MLFDTQLRHVSQSYTNKSFSSSSFSCLPMKVCQPEVCAKRIVQLSDMHCTCLLWTNLSLDMLVVTNIVSRFFKEFQNLPATHEISYKMIPNNLKIRITNIKNLKIITFPKNICSFFYPFKLMSDIFKQEISYFLHSSSF